MDNEEWDKFAEFDALSDIREKARAKLEKLKHAPDRGCANENALMHDFFKKEAIEALEELLKDTERLIWRVKRFGGTIASFSNSVS